MIRDCVLQHVMSSGSVIKDTDSVSLKCNMKVHNVMYVLYLLINTVLEFTW